LGAAAGGAGIAGAGASFAACPAMALGLSAAWMMTNPRASSPVPSPASLSASSWSAVSSPG
jgi:hypothetical protein